MKSLPLHVSVNRHLSRGLSTLQQGLNDNGTEFKDSVPSNQSPFGTILLLSRPSLGRPEAPLIQGRNFKTCPCSPHHTAHGGEEEGLLKFLTIVYPTNKPAVELVTPLPSSTPLDWTYSYQPVKYPPDISQLRSREICYCG